MIKVERYDGTFPDDLIQVFRVIGASGFDDSMTAVVEYLGVPLEEMFGWPGPNGTDTVLNRVTGQLNKDGEYQISVSYGRLEPEVIT